MNNNNTISGWLFVLPYLIVLSFFLLFPFLKGVWISLYDWDLLRVFFDSESKRYVGLDNYLTLLWGENLTWSLGYNMFSRGGALLLILYIMFRIKKSTRVQFTRGNLMLLVIALCIVVVAMGIHPSEEGRWNDLRFWNIFKNTIVFVAITVPAVTGIGLLLAVMLYKSSKANAILRVVFFSTNVLSVTVVTLIWQIMYSPQQGIIANVLTFLGLEPIKWVTSSSLAMVAIIIVTVWWSIGFAMIILIAGLQDIPQEYFEAAELDGANKFQIFRHITLASLMHTIILVLVIQSILHFQVFGQSHLITQGGPGDSTQVLVRYIYQTGFRDSHMGYAAALSFVLFFVMMCISFVQIKVLGAKND